jgi:hypothetical protein
VRRPSAAFLCDFAFLSVRIIVRREDFLSRIFPPRLGHKSDRQAMCNLLLHMQQKVVIGLVAALPRCDFALRKISFSLPA